MTMFSARHYRAVAEILSSHDPGGEAGSPSNASWLWYAHRDAFVAMFKKDNPNFIPEKFNEACEKRNEAHTSPLH